jgi:hypothetical protein
MNLPVPVVGAELGPQYATDINTCMALISQHDHSAGEGNQITPSGLNINAALSLNSNPLWSAQYIQLAPQLAILPGVSPTLSSLYAVGSSLYYNDSIGNQVPIVVNGSVTGATGTITGLPSTPPGAGVSYNSTSQTFTFISAASTPAALDSAYITIRDLSLNGFGVTLNAPSSLALDYDLTLPQVPGSTLPVTLDASGNFGTDQIQTAQIATGAVSSTQIALATIQGDNIAVQTIQSTNIAPVNLVQSGTSGAYITSSTSPTQPTNLIVSITTTGKPVRVELAPDYSGNAGYVSLLNAGGSPNFGIMFIQILRNGAAIYNTTLNATYFDYPDAPNYVYPNSMISFTDNTVTGLAGTYVYQMLVSLNTSAWNALVYYSTLLAYEIR